jgi:hypothetical protein
MTGEQVGWLRIVITVTVKRNLASELQGAGVILLMIKEKLILRSVTV